MSEKKECVLCEIARHRAAAEILYEDEEIMAMLDLFPATRGHILVIPRSHIANIYEMPLETGKKIMECTLRLCRAVKKGLQPDGLNIIQSNLAAGGQTIDHFHLHIVPRYRDDEVILKFGHGSQPENAGVLAAIASTIRKAI